MTQPVAPKPSQEAETKAQSIATMRMQMGLTREQLARFLGVTGQQIYNWESGFTRPKRLHVLAVMAVTQILARPSATDQ